VPSSPVRLLVAPVAVPPGLDAGSVAGRLTAAGRALVSALAGDWAGGGALVTADPGRTVTPGTAEEAFAVPDLLPEVDVAGAPEGAVGGGWFGYLGFGLSHTLWRRAAGGPPVPPTRLLPVAHWAWHDWVLRRPPGAPWRFEALVGPAFPEAAALAVRDGLVALLRACQGPDADSAGPPAAVRVRVLGAPDRTLHAVAVEECVRGPGPDVPGRAPDG
jgi:para-aminobenzoate synthetase component 1